MSRIESRRHNVQMEESSAERISRREFLGHSLFFLGFVLTGVGSLSGFTTPEASQEERDAQFGVNSAGALLFAAGSTLIALAESEKKDETNRAAIVFHTLLAGGALLTVAVYDRLQHSLPRKNSNSFST